MPLGKPILSMSPAPPAFPRSSMSRFRSISTGTFRFETRFERRSPSVRETVRRRFASSACEPAVGVLSRQRLAVRARGWLRGAQDDNVEVCELRIAAHAQAAMRVSAIGQRLQLGVLFLHCRQGAAAEA